METKQLNTKRVAIVATDGYEKIELDNPRSRLLDDGVAVDVVSSEEGRIKAWDHDHWEGDIEVDGTFEHANPADYDLLLLPGGVINPDKLRKNPKAVHWVDRFMESGKPVAAICHGPWTLIETGRVSGRKMTSYESIKTDLKNAGADWRDEEVVVDGNLITSRNPNDLDAFNALIGRALR